MLKATFIGMGKCADTGVRELGGALRDATALWALILDSMQGLPQPYLEIGIETIFNLRSAAHQTLASEAEHDTVIPTFSGHGTRNHRFVTYETSI